MPFGVNPLTSRPRPTPKPARDGDRKQARQRINVEVRSGRRPHPNDLVVAAWGSHAQLGRFVADRARQVLSLLARAGKAVHCFGRNADGAPKHPLYLPRDTPIVPYAL